MLLSILNMKKKQNKRKRKLHKKHIKIVGNSLMN